MPDASVDLIARLVPAILRGLQALEFAARHVAPETLPGLIAALGERDDGLAAMLAETGDIVWPTPLEPVQHCLRRAGEALVAGLSGFAAAERSEQPMLAAYRSLRRYAEACEALYPLAPHMRPVGHFFLEASRRDDAKLAARLADADASRDDTGVLQIDGPSGTRGGASLYVPEYLDPTRPTPLVVALHGGSGNGGAFLWSWLREARTRGFLLLAPTAAGQTWSLMDPEIDGATIDRLVDELASRWTLDRDRLLLTGMSDGGTFTYAMGLRAGCRFTHLAPIAAAFHPLLLTFADPARLPGLPIHIVHGARDWMFPPELARSAERALRQAGAEVSYREIADLSHTYPRDENGHILDWFLAV